MPARDPIAAYLRELGSRLGGPWPRRRRIIAEVRAHLSEAVASDPLAEQDPAAAARRAIARFGTAEETAQAFTAGRERGFRRGRARLGVAAVVAALVCVGVATPLLVLNSGQGPSQSANLNAGRGDRLQGATAVCPAVVPATASAAAGAAARYLGLTDAQLRAQLQAGKSLAQVAGERHQSVDGLTSTIGDAVKRSARDRLDAVIAAKRIPQADESRMVRILSSQTDKFVDRMVSSPRLGLPGCGPRLVRLEPISGPPSS
jgi:HAAS domain-containing protein